MRVFPTVIRIAFCLSLHACLATTIEVLADEHVIDYDELQKLALDVETEINQNLSSELGRESNITSATCIPAKWVSTKVPEFRGFKIYTKEIRTKISPEITCDVGATTYNSGQIEIRANPESMTLEVLVPSQTRVEAVGQGAIGKNVLETSVSDLVTRISFGIGTEESLPVVSRQAVSHNWSTSSQATLFGMISVDAESVAIPSLENLASDIENRIRTELQPQ